MKNCVCVIFIFVLLSLEGCAFLQETGKTLWGSSTRALENARKEALVKEFSCPLETCYNMALELINRRPTEETEVLAGNSPEELPRAEEQETYVLFLENRREHFFVVMGVPGSVNTTEVGVFFSVVREDRVRVEISSLSSYAKARVAHVVFSYLSRTLKPEPEYPSGNAHESVGTATGKP
ncbi:MAG TPA: hypothetical protein PLT76_06455 [Candidatus Omnitrophota bacterium]|nr:hypothetical protein [Candidatus Omnitrophota bacterium]HQO58347.1 hypothetical protein [Candidatus Omnitrophota bacterium]HQP11526.1 hypothetical protein [Candidatus Omnitrophota bacterium]